MATPIHKEYFRNDPVKTTSTTNAS